MQTPLPSVRIDPFTASICLTILEKKNMKRNFIWAFVIACSFLSNSLSADTVVFDFNNMTEFDGNAPAGTTMSATGATDTVVMTSVGVFAPEFEEVSPDVFQLTGNTIAAGTSIGTSNNAIGINNPSISNGDFETFKESTAGTEGNDFNLGESFVVTFDTDVTITEFNFSSIDDDGFFVVEVEGVATPFNFPDGAVGDDFEDPLAGLVIAAGTEITFSVDGPTQEASVRITEITVETVGTPFVLGDVDQSGTVDFLDIGPFITLLSNGGFQAEADIDGSTVVDFLDIGPFIGLLSN